MKNEPNILIDSKDHVTACYWLEVQDCTSNAVMLLYVSAVNMPILKGKSVRISRSVESLTYMSTKYCAYLSLAFAALIYEFVLSSTLVSFL